MQYKCARWGLIGLDWRGGGAFWSVTRQLVLLQGLWQLERLSIGNMPAPKHLPHKKPQGLLSVLGLEGGVRIRVHGESPRSSKALD